MSSATNDLIAMRSLIEILAPVHQQVEASGISDEELDTLFDTLRNKFTEKSRKRNPRGANGVKPVFAKK